MTDETITVSLKSQPTTLTILSTIAIRSQHTQLVLALLKSENFLQLQIIDFEPGVNELPVNVDDAQLARDAHYRILDQLKKQSSPVEELIRKANELRKSDTIDKTEMYEKMAADLTDGWNTIENLLQKRKEILEINVNYRQLIEDYFQSIENARKQTMDENSFVDFEFAKQYSDRMIANRKFVMQKLFSVLRVGNELIRHVNDLKLIGNEIDSRPEQDMANRIKKTLDDIEKSFELISRKRKQFEDFYRLEKVKLDGFLDVLSNAKYLAELEHDLNTLDDEISLNRKYFTLETQDQFRLENERHLQALLKLREKTLRFAYSLEKRDTMITITKFDEKNEQIFELRNQIDNLQLEMNTNPRNGDIVKAYKVLDRLNNLIEMLQKFKTKLTVCNDFVCTKSEMIRTKLIDFENELKTCENHEEIERKLSNLKNDLILGHLESGKMLIGALGKLNVPAVTISETIENCLEAIARKLYEFDLYFESRNIDLAKKDADKKSDDEILRKFNETHKKIANELAEIEINIRKRNSQLGVSLLTTKTIRNESSDNLRQLQTIGTDINRLLNSLLPTRLFTERLHSINESIECLRSRWVSLKNLTEQKFDLSNSLIDFYTKSDEWLSNVTRLCLSIANNDHRIQAEIIENRQTEHNELSAFANNLIVAIENYAKNFTIDETIDSLDSVKSICDKLVDKNCEFELCLKNFDELRDLSNQWDKIMEESLMIVNVATKLRNQLYPIIDFEFNTLSDLINELKRKSTKMLPELDKILHEIDTKIHDTEQLSMKSEQIAQQSQTITRKLRDLRTSLGTIIDEYNQLIRETIDFFVHLQEFDRQLEFENVENNRSQPIASNVVVSSSTNSTKLTTNLDDLEKIQDSLIRKIQQNETNDAAAERDTNVLIAIFQEQKLHLKEVLAKRQKEFDAKQDAILFESNLHGIYKALDQLTDQLNDIRTDLGDSRESVHKNCRLFQTFEKTTEILNEKIYQLCDQDVAIEDSVRNAKLIELNERLQRFETDVKTIKDLLHKSLYYYDLIEKAENWIDNGTELLNEISDKTNLICSVEESQILRNEIEKFLQVDERQQNERINEISKLSFELFNNRNGTKTETETKTDEKNSAQQLIAKNKNIFTSFARIENELNALAVQFEAYRNGDENTRRKFTMRLPEFEKPLTNVLIDAGDTLRLQCVVRGEPDPFIKWTFNGEPLTESDENVRIRNEGDGCIELVRECVGTKHEGYYTIHARNRMGDVNSSCNVYVRRGNDEIDIAPAPVPAPEHKIDEKHPIRPKIQSALKDQKVRLGEQAILECVIVCEPEPEVIWYHDSSLVKESANIKLQFQGDQCSLIIKSTVLEDSGCYRVVAINAAGEASSQCCLNIANQDFQQTRTVKNVTAEECLPIESVPILKRKLENYRIDEGETVVLACEATNVDTYKWFHNNHQLQTSNTHDNNRKYCFDYDRDRNRISLEIRKCSSNDAGAYSVYLTNRIGQVHCTAHVDVIMKPIVTETTESIESIVDLPTAKVQPQPPKIITGLVGRICEQGIDSTLFECIYHVYPANSVEIQWSRNDSQLNANNSENYSIVNLPNKSILKLSNISHKMAGKYSCTIRNSAGSITSTADLVVKKSTFPPVIGRRLKDQELLAGDRIQMEIEVTGTPKPDIVWFKDNVPVSESLAPNDFQIQCTGNHYELIIFAAKFHHSGEYSVKATNSVGETFSNAKISIFEMPKVQQQQKDEESLQQQQTESSFVQKLFYESQEIEKTRLEPKTIEPIIVKNTDSSGQKIPSLSNSTVTATITDTTTSSAKTFEESRLYFIEKLSQNQQKQQQQQELSKKKSLRYSSSLKLDSELNRRRFETSTKSSISPRPEALEMEKLWATSSNNFSVTSKSTGKVRLVDNGYGYYEKPTKDYYNVVYESRNPFLSTNDKNVESETKVEEPERDDTKKPESNFVRSQSESGYIADTEEQHNKESCRNFRNCFDNRFRQQTEVSNNCRQTTSTLSVDKEEKQKMLSGNQTLNRRTTVTNSSPSKFVAQKHLIESDYENESIVRERIAVVWSPAVQHDDTKMVQLRPQPSYKPVRADFSKCQTKNVPFPPSSSGPPSRPKFEPIDKPNLLPPIKPDINVNEVSNDRSQILYKPKPVSVKSQILYRNENEIVLKPGSPPQLLFSDSRPGSCCNETILSSTPLPNPVFYRATAAAVTSIATNNETSLRQFSANCCESNELFDEKNHLYYANKQTNEIEHSNSYRKIDMMENRSITTKPKSNTQPSQLPQRLKKPRKFVPGEPRESDYESELESIRIKPLWNPKEIESNEPHYRPVKVPVVVAASYKQHSFNNVSAELPTKSNATQSTNRLQQMQKIATNTHHNLYCEQNQELSQQQDNLWSTATISKRTRPRDHNNTPPSSTPTTPLHFLPTKNPPYFITPLRDIAVLCGRTARFECIVQSDQTPFISWSTNGRVLNHCKKYDIYYRNGVCRLTITNVTFNDSGNFLCTATNQLGSVNTTGSLQVNNDKRLTFVY